MNLVDAIRAATQKPHKTNETESRPGGQFGAGQVTEGPSTAAPSNVNPSGAVTQTQLIQDCPTTLSTLDDGIDGARLVRFEVLLTQQQIGELLRWLAHQMRSVMTLREAAHYLRLRATQVQALAEHGDLPAFRVDGKWRFLKTTLDEWMSIQHATYCETTPDAQEGKQIA